MADAPLAPVREACAAGDAEALRVALTAHGPPGWIWRPDEDGRNALHWACTGGSAALGAADGGSEALLHALLVLPDASSHANDADEARWTPLMIAASCGKVAAVRALLQAGASADLRTETGQIALHYHKARGAAGWQTHAPPGVTAAPACPLCRAAWQ